MGSLSAPQIGQPNSTEGPKIKTAVEALNALLNSTNNGLADGLATSRVWLPTVGNKSQTGGALALTEARQVVTSCTYSVTPSVPSQAFIFASVKRGGGVNRGKAIIRVSRFQNSVEQEAPIIGEMPKAAAAEADSINNRLTFFHYFGPFVGGTPAEFKLEASRNAEAVSLEECRLVVLIAAA